MNDSEFSLEQKKESLIEQLKGTERYTWSQHTKHKWAFRCLAFLGLVLAASVTISALYWRDAALSGSLSTLVFLVIGLQNAFNFEETAHFQLALHGEAKSLRDRIRYTVTSEDEFRDVFRDFLNLRKRSAEKLPRGEGMRAVKDLYAGGDKERESA